MTDLDLNDVSPEEMAEIMDRLEVGHGAAVDVEPARDSEAENKPGLRARSVKVSDDLDLRCGIRAQELGLSKSAYIRQLIEADLHTAYSDEPEMIPLEEARRAAQQAIEEALQRLSHRPGHAA
ncbi:hypothetical protein ACWDNI_06495 [Nocardia niigatensis]